MVAPVASLQGVVTQQGAGPVADALVTLRGEDDGWEAQATANAQGEYRFEALAAVPYAVEARSGALAFGGQPHPGSG